MRERCTNFAPNPGSCQFPEKFGNKNEEYIKIQDKIAEQREQFHRLNLTKEQCLVVDRLLSVHTESGAIYGKMAHKQGFQDCAALLLEMKLLKAA